MRHAVALLLTLLTTALAAVVTILTGIGACFFWPPLLLLSLAVAYLCRRSPLGRVFCGLPLCGVPCIVVVVLCVRRDRDPSGIGVEGVALLLLACVSVWAVYTGYLGTIRATTGGKTGVGDLE